MTAFDQAFRLLKMPIVPGSLERDEDSHDYRALFDDPKSGEQLGVTAGVLEGTDPETESGRIWAEIENPDDMYNLPGRARTEVGWNSPRIIPGLPKQGHWEPAGISTLGTYQHRGYATALYDVIAGVLEREKLGRLVPSTQQTEAAKRLWSGRGEWPVREDLE